jgi:hypothetical protein
MVTSKVTRLVDLCGHWPTLVPLKLSTQEASQKPHVLVDPFRTTFLGMVLFIYLFYYYYFKDYYCLRKVEETLNR